MRNVLRPDSSAETASASVSSPIVSRRRFLLQGSLAALLCSQIPGDQKTEKREAPELLTCKRILELLEAHGIDGARTVNTVLRPNDPAHVFLHIPQRHAITFMSPENQRAVRASQADIERMILDMHARLGVREVFPENMVPCNLRDREEFVTSGDREKDLLEGITFQRKLLEDSNKHPGDPEAMRLLEQRILKNIASMENELALFRRMGKKAYDAMKLRKIDESDAEFDAALRLEMNGIITRKMCGTDAALKRASQMRDKHNIHHPAVLDEREDDAIRTILAGARGIPLLVVPYGSAHDFTNNVQAHNAAHPDRTLALVVAEPLSHAKIKVNLD